MEVCREKEYASDFRKYGHLQYMNQQRPGTMASRNKYTKSSFSYAEKTHNHNFLSPKYRGASSPYLDGPNHESTSKLHRPKKRYNKDELIEFMK